MKKTMLWNKRSVRDQLVGGIWMSFFVVVLLARHITLPAMPWWTAIKLAGLICALCTPIFATVGYMADRLNIRGRYGYRLTWEEAKFLDSCEAQVEENGD